VKNLARKVLRRVRRIPPIKSAADAMRPRRAVTAIRASGLFDEGWYLEQLDEPLPAGTDPVAHYVRHGARRGLAPSPCFIPSWYLERRPALRKAGVEPFMHFVTRGARRGEPPHPVFDAKRYRDLHPESVQHPGGPLGHYLAVGWRQGAEPHRLFDTEAYLAAHPDVEGPAFLHFARRAGRAYRAQSGYADYPRTVAEFDEPESEGFKQKVLTEFATSGMPSPLVSVIIPTKDRAASVLEAVRSVQAQTYTNWQLIVVDDGSTDGTEDALAPLLEDQRIEYLRRERPGGVAAARNAGLARARGEYVAYLDSDNTWLPDFLAVMVAYVVPRGIRFGYAVSELREQPGGKGRLAYRGATGPFDAGALRERNFIDCIVVLHERSLVEEVGRFDESLRRMVDWDLFIRMSRITEFVPVPFVATVYDAWEDRDDRITISEPWGYRFVIKAKSMLDWIAAAEGLPSRTPGLTSVVLHAAGDVQDVVPCLDRLYEGTKDDVEVVVVDAGRTEGDAAFLQLLQARFERLQLIRVAEAVSKELASNLGAISTRGEYLAFLLHGTWVDDDWLAPLKVHLADGSASAVQPRVLTGSGIVASAGLGFARGGISYHLFRGFPGDAPEVLRETARPALAPLGLVVRADDFVAVRGFDPILVNDTDTGDFSLRLAHHTGRPSQYVPNSMVALPTAATTRVGPSARRQLMDNRTIVLERWQSRVPAESDHVWLGAGLKVVGYEDAVGEPTHRGVGGIEPIVVRDRDPRPLRWAIKTGVPTVARRQSWGDWHFALALKDALERLGQEVVVDCKRAWHRPSTHLDDVALVLRGVSEYAVSPQHINVMWMISHPERVTAQEAATYDAVFVASPSVATRFTASRGIPAQPLLQCTDPSRFRPVPPDPYRAHDLLFVGNARGVRPSVQAALDAGLEPAVYGVRWQNIVPPHLWKGPYLPNEDLAAVYCAAGAVLNDHWEDMRRDGFLSNRLFDLAACGARVISDKVPGLNDTFGDVILTYETHADVATAVKAHLNECEKRAAARLALSEYVRRVHSFDARARTLVDTVNRLRTAKRTEN
jgi:glycosyltransferase involved in cell wall biosynthesis